MRIRITLDIERSRPPVETPERESDLGSHLEASGDDRIGFRANVPDMGGGA